MDLHDKITNIQVDLRQINQAINEAMRLHDTTHDIRVAIYAAGHRDARQKADELLAKEQSKNP